jgi:hypothetical protein
MMSTTTEPTIEECLKELREMFRGKGNLAPYITAGFDPDNDWHPLVVIHWVANGTSYWTDKASTLSEAMAQVRARHKEQSK